MQRMESFRGWECCCMGCDCVQLNLYPLMAEQKLFGFGSMVGHHVVGEDNGMDWITNGENGMDWRIPPFQAVFGHPGSENLHDCLFGSLNVDILEYISLFLAPRDRLNLGLCNKEMMNVVWNGTNVWNQMAYALQNGMFGGALKDVFLAQQKRRNRQRVSMRQVVLKTVYNLCLGCERNKAGIEKITGLSLCPSCLSGNQRLGVVCRTRAKREYLLNDKDLEELGERSAVLEYDCNRLIVRRVHFYRRALLKKAWLKYGGPEAYEQVLLNRDRRRASLALKKKEKRSAELRQALAFENGKIVSSFSPTPITLKRKRYSKPEFVYNTSLEQLPSTQDDITKT
mmetsp:Transcript_2696/g.4747  ORF Transcript_2696/g.4747 Transcript_2696/m.4747 type:complete len:341 (-) Transcript_2696:99-1121(-)